MTRAGSAKRVREHRSRLAQQGLRPVQIWVPDVRAPGFAEEAHRQSRAVAEGRSAVKDKRLSMLSPLGPMSGAG